MGQREPRQVKHDLLTPVNHVIGYAELVRDDAADLGHDEVAAALQEVADLGARVAAGIRTGFAGGLMPDPAELERVIAPAWAACVERVATLQSGDGREDIAQDLERIATGLESLRQRLDEELGISLGTSWGGGSR